MESCPVELEQKLYGTLRTGNGLQQRRKKFAPVESLPTVLVKHRVSRPSEVETTLVTMSVQKPITLSMLTRGTFSSYDGNSRLNDLVGLEPAVHIHLAELFRKIFARLAAVIAVFLCFPKDLMKLQLALSDTNCCDIFLMYTSNATKYEVIRTNRKHKPTPFRDSTAPGFTRANATPLLNPCKTLAHHRSLQNRCQTRNFKQKIVETKPERRRTSRHSFGELRTPLVRASVAPC